MTEQRRVLATGEELAREAAAALVAELARIQQDGRVPSVVLTGGSIAAALHRAVADSPDRDRVDWSRVEFWFGDERFVPAADPDRNAGQAAEAMLDRLPVDPARVHAMPAADGAYGADVAAAAAGYADELSRVLAAAGGADTVDGADAADGAEAAEGEPLFDVLMLGIGPDGHCASLFPGRPEVSAAGSTVAVDGSPKPPPVRISLTMPTLQRARQVWFVAAGAEKADAVAASAAGARDAAEVSRTPAAGPRGRERTVWWLDRAAASQLPDHPAQA